jgi:hypothetical protein
LRKASALPALTADCSCAKRGGVAVLPLAGGSGETQTLLGKAGIEAAVAVEGGAGRATEAGFGRIELGKAEIGTLTIASRYRSDDFGTVVETLAISGPA